MNTNKFKSERETFALLHYLNTYLHRTQNKKQMVLLDCFIEHHKSFCVKEDCPARKNYTKTRQLSKIFQEDYEDANRIQMVYLIESLYLSAIERYNIYNNFKILFIY